MHGKWEEGQIFGDFRLVERINAGGMGEVWRADQISLGRAVAVKLLLPKFVFSDRARRQFQREAEAGGRIQHPGIVTVYTAGFSGHQPYIAQELVKGGYTLANFIADVRELPSLPPGYHHQVAEFLASVLDALQVAHDAGVIHRDLKPQNILISPEDTPKIADFGLAQIVDEEPLSQTGDFAGTYSYMSPEQAAARRSGIDHRTDVFSLGVTFYEMLTFHRAFDGVTTHEITKKVLFFDPPDPRGVKPQTPRDLALICAKAMEKAPDHRYSTAGEFAADLRRYLRDEPIAARPTGVVRKVQKLVRRHPTPAAIAIVGTLALIVIAWLGSLWLASQESERVAERDKLYWQAQFAIEMDDMDAAIGLVDQANELDPASPAGHLILAIGFAKYARVPEQEAQIALAIEKGFTRDPDALETAADHASYGLYLASQRDLGLFPEAEIHLRRALELDPTLYGINFRLYQLRSELGDLEGARRYLEAFQQRLATGETFYSVVEAMKEELEGDYDAACQTLEALAADPALDDERTVQLRIHRNLGRNYLKSGQLDRAEELLRKAVDEAPDDCVSRLALAEVFYTRDDGLGDEERGPELLEEADRMARQAITCNPSKPEPYRMRAMIAVDLFSREPTSGDARSKPAYQAAEARLAELRDHGEADASLESRLLFFEGVYPYERGNYAEAISLFEASVELDPENLFAWALLGQCCWRVGEHARGADYLDGCPASCGTILTTRGAGRGAGSTRYSCGCSTAP